MSSVLKPMLTPQEYLARERKAEFKSEYATGVIYAMSGGTREHHLIAGNFLTEMNLQLKQTRCEIYGSDMKVRTPDSRKFFYPDITVVCTQPGFHDEERDALLNPISKSVGTG